MTTFRLIILLHAIKAITIFLTEDSTKTILEDPRLRFLKFARITTTPREAITSPPFTGNARLGELAIEASMKRQTALVVQEIFVIALEVVVVALAACFAVQCDLPRCIPSVLRCTWFRGGFCFCSSRLFGCCDFRSLDSVGSGSV